MDRLIPYADWSTRPRGATPADHPIGATKGITAHWEGPHMGTFAHSECAGKVRGIQAFHRDHRGWADIAYNALVCPHGYVFEGRGPNVTSAANGGTQVNADYYAVCYLSGEDDSFTDEGRDGFLWAFGWLTRQGGAGPERNGHLDVRPEPTACPGPEIYRWVHSLPRGATETTQGDEIDMATMDDLRAAIRAELDDIRYTDRDQPNIKRSISGALLEVDRNARIAARASDPDAIAAAVVKRLGSNADAATVKAAVKDAIRELVEE